MTKHSFEALSGEKELEFITQGGREILKPPQNKLSHEGKVAFCYHAFGSHLPDDIVKRTPKSFYISPKNQNQIHTILEVANVLQQNNLLAGKLLPTAQNKNWGYNEVPLDGIQIDLSNLKGIKFEQHGNKKYVTVEPGVTQRDYYEFLLETTGTQFFPAISAAGPNTSILGNALDRGFGPLPMTSHFNAIASVSFLPGHGQSINQIDVNYDYAHNLLRSLEGKGADDPLHARTEDRFQNERGKQFALQSLYRGAFGIVTEAKIELQERSKYFVKISFDILNPQKYEDAFRDLSVLMKKYEEGGLRPFSHINEIALSNSARQLPLHIDFPHDQAGFDFGKNLTHAQIEQLAAENDIAPWQAYVSISTDDASIVRNIINDINDKTKPYAQNHTMTFSGKPSMWLELWAKSMRSDWAMSYEGKEALGRPNELDPKTAYWRNPNGCPDIDLNPQRDGCGIRWGKFVGPVDKVSDMKNIIEQTYQEYGFDPMIRIRMARFGQVYCLSPMTYEKTDKNLENAKASFVDVFNKLKAIGFEAHGIPYDLMYKNDLQRRFADVVTKTPIAMNYIDNPFMNIPVPHPFEEDKSIYINGTRLAGIINTRETMKSLDPNRVLQDFIPIW